MRTQIHVTRAIAILKEDTHSSMLPLCCFAEDGEFYYTKTAKSKSGYDHHITSEFLCHKLLSFWKIETPKIAEVYINPLLISQDRSLSEYQRSGWSNDSMCFGSRIDNGSIAFTALMDDTHYWTIKAFEDPIQWLKIGLFDLWVVNAFRTKFNPSIKFSIGKTGRLKPIPYDFEHAFGDTELKNLTTSLSLSTENTILDTLMARKIYISHTADNIDQKMKAYFEASVLKCLDHYEDVIDILPTSYRLPPKSEEKLRSFLFDVKRNQSLFEDFKDHFKS
jgi:hypothetical protein